MAAKGKAPKKFKQARTAAKADAKKVFSGKTKARLKDRTDPLTKYSADDKKALSEVTKEAKGNYITDDRGNKVRTVPTETAKERFNREGFQAREKFRQDMANEFKEPYGGKKPEGMDTKPSKATKPAKSVAAPAKPATAGKKATTKKPATKGYSVGKSLNSVGQGRYDALVKEGVAPKKAMNKALFFQEKGVKAQTKAGMDKAIKNIGAKPVSSQPTAAAKAINDMGKKKGLTDVMGIEKKPTASKDVKSLKVRVAAAKKTAKPAAKAANTAKAVTKASTASKVGKVILDAAKTTAMVAGPGKVLKAGSLIKGALGATKAVKVTKAVKAAESGKKVAAANTARKAANAAKAEKAAKAGVKGKVKKVGLAAAGFYAIDKIPTGGGSRQVGSGGEAFTGKTAAKRTGPMSDWSKRSSAKINKTFTTAGGSTTSYTVKKGDTLSGIAKASGVKLSEVLAANPTIADKKSKYKGGSMIWSGTKVKLPTKK
jgi:LysM repeat protein